MTNSYKDAKGELASVLRFCSANDQPISQATIKSKKPPVCRPINQARPRPRITERVYPTLTHRGGGHELRVGRQHHWGAGDAAIGTVVLPERGRAEASHTGWLWQCGCHQRKCRPCCCSLPGYVKRIHLTHIYPSHVY